MKTETEMVKKSIITAVPFRKDENIFKVLSILNKILDALGEFKGRYNKKFNFSKLAAYLNIPSNYLDDFISIILKFQERFHTVFKDYQIQKRIINHQIYFTLEENFDRTLDLNIDQENQESIIHINKTHMNHLSDIIYLFQYIKKGRGFDLKPNKTELMGKLIELRKAHPYFFIIKESGLIYPSELGLELGNLIRSYDKSNKTIENIEIKKFKFIID